jgi:hypothetical protein
MNIYFPLEALGEKIHLSAASSTKNISTLRDEQAPSPQLRKNHHKIYLKLQTPSKSQRN